MNYNEYISDILKIRPNIKQEGVYMERHHIVPKCMGGSNNEDNLIWLTSSEHYIAHKLLANENVSNKKLQYAFWRMCHTKFNKHIVSKEDMDIARRGWCKNITEAKYKKVICLETGIVYNSLKECANSFETSLKNISRVCKNSKRSWKNLHFDFYDKNLHTPDFCKKEIARRIERKRLSRIPSKEHLEKLRLAKIGKPRYDMRGCNNKKARKVFCKELNKVFDCLADAGRFIGKTTQDIYNVCIGKQKTTAGYHFNYYNGEEK